MVREISVRQVERYKVKPRIVRSDERRCGVTKEKIDKMRDCVVTGGYAISEEGVRLLVEKLSEIDYTSFSGNKTIIDDTHIYMRKKNKRCTHCYVRNSSISLKLSHSPFQLLLQSPHSSGIHLCYPCLSYFISHLKKCQSMMNESIFYSEPSGFAVIDTEEKVPVPDIIEEKSVETSTFIEVGCTVPCEFDIKNLPEFYDGITGDKRLIYKTDINHPNCLSCHEDMKNNEMPRIKESHMTVCPDCLDKITTSMKNFIDSHSDYIISKSI